MKTSFGRKDEKTEKNRRSNTVKCSYISINFRSERTHLDSIKYILNRNDSYRCLLVIKQTICFCLSMDTKIHTILNCNNSFRSRFHRHQSDLFNLWRKYFSNIILRLFNDTWCSCFIDSALIIYWQAFMDNHNERSLDKYLNWFLFLRHTKKVKEEKISIVA